MAAPAGTEVTSSLPWGLSANDEFMSETKCQVCLHYQTGLPQLGQGEENTEEEPLPPSPNW